MPISDFDIHGWVREGTRVNRVGDFDPCYINKATNYTIMWAQVVVMHVTSYDVLVGGVMLYPIRIIVDFWEETTYYCLSW